MKHPTIISPNGSVKSVSADASHAFDFKRDCPQAQDSHDEGDDESYQAINEVTWCLRPYVNPFTSDGGRDD